MRVVLTRVAEELDAANPLRRYVGNDRVERRAGEPLGRRYAVVDRLDLVTGLLEEQDGVTCRLIFDEEDPPLLRARRGVYEAVAPLVGEHFPDEDAPRNDCRAVGGVVGGHAQVSREAPALATRKAGPLWPTRRAVDLLASEARRSSMVAQPARRRARSMSAPIRSSSIADRVFHPRAR